MKLKGLTKLVLAGTALAATAATLTTSTYAWYVTNNKVEATGVSGATAGSTVAGSLLIASDVNNLPGEYTTSIALDTSAASGLNPQTMAPKDADGNQYFVTSDETKQNGKQYYTLGTGSNNSVVATNFSGDAFTAGTVYYEKSTSTGQVWLDKEGKVMEPGAAGMVTFSFWLKASQTMSGLNVTTTFANSATAAFTQDGQKQTLYSTNGLPNNKTKGDLYKVDAVYALRMNVVQQAYTITGATPDVYNETTDTTFQDGKTYYTTDGNTYTAATVTTGDAVPTGENATKYYELTAATAGTATVSGDPTSTTVGAVENHNATNGNVDYASPVVASTSAAIFDSPTGDANIYYKSVMKKAGYGTDSSTGASVAAPSATWANITLQANIDTKFTVTIWLEGTDAQCWDSCIGQNFTLNLKFEKSGSGN